MERFFPGQWKLPIVQKAPEKWWSEDDPILFGLGLFWFWGMVRLGDLGFQPSTMYRQQKQGTTSFRKFFTH